MGNQLENRTVVVIGGSSGIGHAVAVAAAAEGARVFALSRSGIAPDGVQGIAVDVNDAAALAQAFAGIGEIDHLVHTAGARSGNMALPGLEPHAMSQLFGTKLFGAVQAIRQALPHLSQHASVTLTSGQVSRKFGTGTMVKGALNAAVDAAGRHLAKELAPHRVNVVSPGVVDTDLWGAPGSAGRLATVERVSAGLPVGRVARPEELAHAYVFAMTNAFLTGAVLDVDGGGLL
jgi:NAD(P)-dependent dehydrogenase (short-subunit alcohol dehydrogenase family)